MFRIVCYVEDKHLHKVLHAVAGLVVNMEPPQPVVNAVVVKSGKTKAVKEATPTGGSFKGQLVEWLGTKKGSRISNKDMKEHFVSIGGNPGSVNGVLIAELTEAKVIKRISRGIYQPI